MYDRVLRNGLILAGTGQPGFVADVAIAGGRIAAVGQLGAFDGEEIDAAGLVVAPGLIDDQGVSDAAVLGNPDQLLARWPGVTTLLLNPWEPAVADPRDQGAGSAGPPAPLRESGPGRWPIHLAWLGAQPLRWVYGAPVPETLGVVAEVARQQGVPIVWRPATSAPPPSWPRLWETLEEINAEALQVYWYMTDWPAANHADTVVELLQRPDILLGGFPLDPRDAAGTFLRGRLAPWRRWPGRVPLERLVQKLTDWPARVWGLCRRGRIQPEHVADLVIFNADTGELAQTFVAGEPVFADGQPTGARPGELLCLGNQA